MASAADLERYLTDGLDSCADTVGAEVETLFVDASKGGKSLMSFPQSQRMFEHMVGEQGWRVDQRTPSGVTIALQDEEGNRCLYDGGHANIEMVTIPGDPSAVLRTTHHLLAQLYRAGEEAEAFPYRAPIFEDSTDTLVDLTPRDRSWIALDGREAFERMGRIACFQLTVAVSIQKAIPIINRLHENTDLFLQRFPQDRLWRDYLQQSRAGYRQDRFGGPSRFDSLGHYCHELAQHQMIDVMGQRLVPFAEVDDPDFPLFLRSVWWYFRLKKYTSEKYGNQLCIEVRPNGRYQDHDIDHQFSEICQLFEHPAVIFK